MQATPRALRPHIGLFGRRTVGKSSLLNAITRQQVADALVTMSALTGEGVGDFREALLQLAPADLAPYRLVVHCGNCTGNRREMLSRIHRCRGAGVPITNYGLTIACSLGVFERALAPFPPALEAYHAARS